MTIGKQTIRCGWRYTMENSRPRYNFSRDSSVTALAITSFIVKVTNCWMDYPARARRLGVMDQMESAVLSDEAVPDFLDPETTTDLVVEGNRSDQLEDADFAVIVLQALARMAARSKRRQADLTAALHGAGIVAEPARVRAALGLLRAQGAIEKLVPLSDGGLLLSVTNKGAKRGSPAPQWLPLEDLDATAR